MKCSFCGKELKDGATFCSFCGTKATSGGATANASVSESVRAPMNSIVEEAPVKKKNKEKKNKGKKKRGLVIGSIILLAAILVTSVVIGLLPLFKNDALYPASAVEAYVDSKGNAYFCYDNGERVQVGSNVDTAYLTSDRSNVVVLTKDGLLYLTDTQNSRRVEIYSSSMRFVSNAEINEQISLRCICDNMIYYTVSRTETSNKIIYSGVTQFETDEVVEQRTLEHYVFYFAERNNFLIGDSSDIRAIALSNSAWLSSGNCSVSYAKDGTVYVLRGESGDLTTVGSYSDTDEIYINGVSADGEYVLWSKKNGNLVNVYLSDHNNSEPIENYEDENGVRDFTLNCTQSSSDGVIVLSENYVYLMKNGKLSKKEASSAIGSSYVVAVNGMPLVMCEQYDLGDGFFIVLEGDEGYDVVLMDERLGKHKIASDVIDFYVSGNYLIYMNDDGVYSAELDTENYKISDASKISGVDYAYDLVFVEGIAYFTDEDGTLFRYDAEEGSKEKIASDVAYFAPTEDGNEVYYINKATNDGGVRRGKLCVTDDKETVTIAKDVIVGSVTSNVVGDVLVSGNVWYETYASGTLEEGYKFNAAYYNGKKEKIMIKNISRKTSSEG